MNTDQKYSAQDHCANTSEQPVNPVANPATVDSQQAKPTNESEFPKSRTEFEAALEKHEAELAIAQAELVVIEQGQTAKVNALLDLCQWAQETMADAHKKRGLSASEKDEINRILKARIDHWTFLIEITSTKQGQYTPSIDSTHESVRELLEAQAALNEAMSWFELPPFPLPDHIRPKTTTPPRQYLVAFHNKMSPLIKKGDSLSCAILERADYFKTGGVLGVVFRVGKRTVRQLSYGRVKRFDANYITLVYDNPFCKQESITIPLRQVLFVLRIESVQSPSKVIK